jgi:hypothetical protein
MASVANPWHHCVTVDANCLIASRILVLCLPARRVMTAARTSAATSFPAIGLSGVASSKRSAAAMGSMCSNHRSCQHPVGPHHQRPDSTAPVLCRLRGSAILDDDESIEMALRRLERLN